MHEIHMCLVILEVLSNPLLGDGDLTADFTPVHGGEFDTTICQILCGDGGGMKLTSALKLG